MDGQNKAILQVGVVVGLWWQYSSSLLFGHVGHTWGFIL